MCVKANKSKDEIFTWIRRNATQKHHDAKQKIHAIAWMQHSIINMCWMFFADFRFDYSYLKYDSFDILSCQVILTRFTDCNRDRCYAISYISWIADNTNDILEWMGKKTTKRQTLNSGKQHFQLVWLNWGCTHSVYVHLILMAYAIKMCKQNASLPNSMYSTAELRQTQIQIHALKFHMCNHFHKSSLFFSSAFAIGWEDVSRQWVYIGISIKWWDWAADAQV